VTGVQTCALPIYKRALGDTINGLAEIARRTGDPDLMAAVRQLQIEYAKLGKVVNQTAKEIDATLKQGLTDTLTDIITRTKSVGEAFRQLAVTILAEIARILAAHFVDKFFGGMLNTGSGNSIGNTIANILGLGNPKPSATPSPVGGGIENIPLIITNFNKSTTSSLGQINNSTKDVSDTTERGFGIVNSNLGSAIGLLGNIASGILAMAAAAAAAAITNIIKILGASAAPAPDAPGGASGGLITGPGTGTSDSIWARLSNGEFVIREWAVRKIGLPVLEHINRMGAPPDAQGFAFGGLVGVAAGVGPSYIGDSINLSVYTNITTQNKQSFTGSEQQIHRDIARAAEKGVRRAKSRPK